MDRRKYFVLICASSVLLALIYGYAGSTTSDEGQHWSALRYNAWIQVHLPKRAPVQLWQTQQDEASRDEAVLPPRADAWCSTTVDATLASGDYAEALFNCRAGVAQRQAEAACERLARDPPDPPFAQVTLNLRRYTAGHTPAPRAGAEAGGGVPRELPQSLTLAAEAEGDTVSASIKRKGTWEVSEVDAVLTALERAAATADPARSQPPLLLDVGANLGVFSVAAAALGYRVVAFEPLARNVAAIHQTLCWNPELRGHVTLFPYGLGAEERDCVVVSADGNVGDGHLVCSEAEARPYRRSMAPRAPAHSVRLGDYLAGVQADVVKLDVEGYEPHVLAGAGDVLDGVQFALSEVSSDMAKATGESFHVAVKDYMRTWDRHGFNIHLCQPGFGCLQGQPWEVGAAAREAEDRELSNIVLVRRRGGDSGGAGGERV